jgi:hypothetical protein
MRAISAVCGVFGWDWVLDAARVPNGCSDSLLSPPGPLGVGYRRADAGAADGALRVAPSRRARGAELALDLIDEVLVELAASIA